MTVCVGGVGGCSQGFPRKSDETRNQSQPLELPSWTGGRAQAQGALPPVGLKSFLEEASQGAARGRQVHSGP